MKKSKPQPRAHNFTTATANRSKRLHRHEVIRFGPLKLEKPNIYIRPDTHLPTEAGLNAKRHIHHIQMRTLTEPLYLTNHQGRRYTQCADYCGAIFFQEENVA